MLTHGPSPRSLFASACLGTLLAFTPDALASEVLTVRGTLNPEPLGGQGDIHAVGPEQWLLAVADGLALWTPEGMNLLARGSFESIDARQQVVLAGRPHLLISLIDVDRGKIRLLAYDAGERNVVDLAAFEHNNAIPETQCLFRNPESGDISLFSIDARGTLEQRYVYDGQREEPTDLLVRRDVAVPEAEACAVHDASSSLFMAEQPLGIWRYAASEESDPLRDPVLLRAPHGRLAGEVEDLAVDVSGALWVLVQEPGFIYRVPAASEATQEWALPSDTEATALAIQTLGGYDGLAIYDEARDLHLVTAAPDVAPGEVSGKQQIPVLFAAAQTAPVRRFGDAADDPAIFVDRVDPAASLILGTDKREGLAVYALDGKKTQLLAVGRVNNVDILTDIILGDQRRTVAAASNRSNDSISLFEIEDRRVRHLADIPTGLEGVYGLCMHDSASGAYVFINATDGRYEQYRLGWSNGEPEAVRVREWQLPSQPEGCVADPGTGLLYMGEEAAGIWRTDAEPDGGAPTLVVRTSDALVADVEGMDIYRNTRSAYLVVSSQGSDSFALFDLNDDYSLAGVFRVGANLAAGVDGVSETDGLAVTAAALPGYPEGMLVVQDGRNRMPDAPQNFKIIDWRELDALLRTTD